MGVEIYETWNKLKEGFAIVAEEMCERADVKDAELHLR